MHRKRKQMANINIAKLGKIAPFGRLGSADWLEHDGDEAYDVADDPENADA